MNQLLLALPLVLVLVTIVYGVFGSLLRIWLDHRLKLALLEKLDKNPGILPPSQELRYFLEGVPLSQTRSSQQNYALTGFILTGIGLFCTVWGRAIGVGQVAVGAYLGGVICICLGLVLAVAGILIRNIQKSVPVISKDKR